MRVPVKLLGFVFWLFSFNFVQCQDCLREDITHEDIELVEKPSYKHGEQVKVNCKTGFTGMYRLQCEKGQWKTTLKRQCKKKKCSNPGDTPNGEFKLLDGSEFVFGATVVYTCNKGFEMMSKINQRTCRSQGWDNTLPVCEVVKCPHIRTDESVTASGNTEDGKYSDAIQFECVSSDQMLDGSSDIYCTEMGEWSGSVPTCKDITCTAPHIPNSSSNDRTKEYRKDDILQYSCSPRFKRREGNPRCSRFGWTLNPECNEVTCELKSPTFGVTEPAGKTFFRAGERVKITCDEKYMIFFTKEAVKSFRCQENGEWDDQPVCVEIRCEDPHDQNVYWPRSYSYVRGDRTLGAKHSYRCLNGYYTEEGKTAGEATCTRAGWTPNPLCVKMCEAPKIPKAEIVRNQRPKYTINSEIQYKCKTGFEPEQPVKITCNFQTEWTGIPECTVKCPEPKNGIKHFLGEKKYFYTCNEGYKKFTGKKWDSVTCIEGSWSEEPLCIPEEKCGAFPSVPNGKLNQSKNTFRDGETTAFECEVGFKSTNIKCVRGTWETPVCEKDVGCDNPKQVENALIPSKPLKFYGDGSSVTYVCRSSYVMNGKDTVFCLNGTWEEKPTCEEIRCEVPPDQNGSDSLFTGNEKLDAKTNFSCLNGYYTEEGKTAGVATCTRDGWKPNPLCEFRCKVLPDQNGSEPDSLFTGNEKLGAKTNYSCLPGYYTEDGKTAGDATCTRDGWKPNPLCEFRCEVPRDQHVFEPDSFFNGNETEGAKSNYSCSPGYYTEEGKMEGEATCTRAGWTPNPLCAEIRCKVPRDQNVFTPDSFFTGNETEGAKTNYSCLPGYYTKERKTAGDATCTRDGWTPNPLCEFRCEVPRDQHVRRPELYFTGNETLGEKKEYPCLSEYSTKDGQRGGWATCTRDGWTPIPLCVNKKAERELE